MEAFKALPLDSAVVNDFSDDLSGGVDLVCACPSLLFAGFSSELRPAQRLRR
jgi:hypothetical protein